MSPKKPKEIIDDCFPLSFEQWLKRPFLSYVTSHQATKEFDSNTRFFQLSENEIQELNSAAEKNLKEQLLQKDLGRLERERIQKNLKSRPRRKDLSRSKREALITNLRSDAKFSNVFQTCQAGDDEMLTALGDETVRRCEHLFILAETGNRLAAKFLAEIAIKATKGLEHVTANYYEDLQGVAAIEYAWPVIPWRSGPYATVR